MDRPRLSAHELELEPQRLYHAAPLEQHDSILEHGIDPKRFPRERWSESDLGVWCFDTLERAVDYARARSDSPVDGPFEVWAIEAAGLEMKRPNYDPHGPLPMAGVDVWWLTEPVPAERVSLASSPDPAPEPGLGL